MFITLLVVTFLLSLGTSLAVSGLFNGSIAGIMNLITPGTLPSAWPHLRARHPAFAVALRELLAVARPALARALPADVLAHVHPAPHALVPEVGRPLVPPPLRRPLAMLHLVLPLPAVPPAAVAALVLALAVAEAARELPRVAAALVAAQVVARVVDLPVSIEVTVVELPDVRASFGERERARAVRPPRHLLANVQIVLPLTRIGVPRALAVTEAHRILTAVPRRSGGGGGGVGARGGGGARGGRGGGAEAGAEGEDCG